MRIAKPARVSRPAPERRRALGYAALATLGAVMFLAACRPAQTLAEPSDGGKAAPGKAKTMKTLLSESGHDVTPLPREEVARLAKKLDPEAYRVTQKAGTEAPFCGNLLDNKKEGVYACVVCGLPLFSSEHKFESGTGWPSFFREVDPAHVARKSSTGATGWRGSRSTAPAAARTSGTSSRTARARPASGTA
jgi:hypothetical protein